MQNFSRDVLAESAGGSIYKLVILATKRALEIAEGSPKLIDVDNSLKPTTVAIMEIAQNKIKIKKIKE